MKQYHKSSSKFNIRCHASQLKCEPEPMCMIFYTHRLLALGELALVLQSKLIISQSLIMDDEIAIPNKNKAYEKWIAENAIS